MEQEGRMGYSRGLESDRSSLQVSVRLSGYMQFGSKVIELRLGRVKVGVGE